MKWNKMEKRKFVKSKNGIKEILKGKFASKILYLFTHLTTLCVSSLLQKIKSNG